MAQVGAKAWRSNSIPPGYQLGVMLFIWQVRRSEGTNWPFPSEKSHGPHAVGDIFNPHRPRADPGSSSPGEPQTAAAGASVPDRSSR